MEAKFSNRVKEVISLSREEAIRLGHDYIGTEHLLLGMIREGEGTALGLLKKLGVSTDELKFALEQATRNTASQGTSITGSIPLTKQTEKVLKITYLEAKIFKSEIIGTEHLLLSILRDEDNISSQILSKFNVNYETVRDSLDYHGAAPTGPKAGPEADDDDDRLFGQGQGGAGRGGGRILGRDSDEAGLGFFPIGLHLPDACALLGRQRHGRGIHRFVGAAVV